MKNPWVGLVILIWVIASTSWARENPPINPDPFPNLMQFIDSNKVNWVVVEIDNTLMVPVQSLGSEPWRRDLIQRYQKLGLSLEQAEKKAGEMWIQVQKKTLVQPVAQNAAQVIQGLQEAKIPVLGITVRPPDLSAKTQQQLASLGIDFNKSPISPKNVTLSKPEGSQYISGILYIGLGVEPASALQSFIQQIDLVPQKLIYTDDKSSRMSSIRLAVETIPGIEFIGILYQGIRALENRYDPELARIQEKDLDKLISDEEAKKKLKN